LHHHDGNNDNDRLKGKNYSQNSMCTKFKANVFSHKSCCTQGCSK